MTKYDTSRPYAASYVLVQQAGKFAFVLRKNTNWMNGYYGLPSGKVEVNESFSAAAIREAKEEIGIDIIPEQLKQVLTMYRREHGEDMEWVDVFFEVPSWQGEPYNAEPHMHSELAWFDPANLPTNVIPSIKFALGKLQSGTTYCEYISKPVL